VPQQSTNDEDFQQPSTIGNRQLGTWRIIALIRGEDQESMSELAAIYQDFDICATADEFLAKCSSSQYRVAILPGEILSPDDRMLLQSYLSSLEVHPSIILYSLAPVSSAWSGWLEAEDLTVIMRPFTLAKVREVISHAIEEFGERSSRRRC
jgi:hypothetical protein